jgi:hypothetical protein
MVSTHALDFIAKALTMSAYYQWQSIAATLLVVGFIVVYAFTSARNWKHLPSTAPSSTYPTNDEFNGALLTVTSKASGAEAFAERAKGLNTAFLDSMKALDDKSSAILGYVGGGSGLIALAAGSEKLLRPTLTPLLILAAVFLGSVLGCCVAVMYPRQRGSVDVEQCCNVGLLTSIAGTNRINAIIGREYIEASRLAAAVVRKKSFFLSLAQLCFAFGVASVVINAIIPGIPPHSGEAAATTITCTPKDKGFECKTIPAK